MIPLLLRRLRDKVWPEPLPPAGSFEGQTILITGATAGLGLAATIHFVMLGASVAITSRSRAQGRMAKSAIENRTGTAGQNKVHVFELDMSNYASCVAFMEQLKSAEETRSGLDVAVLNAGLINARYVRSPEGW
jgi:NAD(P)-dependent dehydrogenase (short-subunit alcohol dehydrogenase family)